MLAFIIIQIRHVTFEEMNNIKAPEEFENAALFLRLGLPSTIFRHENGAFRKRYSNRRNFKTSVFLFRVNAAHFENGDFIKCYRRVLIM